MNSSVNLPLPLPRHVAVIGAAGGLGQGILSVCRGENIAFTAIVRSRPERITGVPDKSRVVVVSSLGDRVGLTAAFSGVDAVIAAIGVTAATTTAPPYSPKTWLPLRPR
jgi:putative NADH-flavin reductase